MKFTRIKIVTVFICSLFCCVHFSCSKDDSMDDIVLHSPLIDLGIDDAEVESRLTTSLVGKTHDGLGNPENLCGNGKIAINDR